MPGERQSGHAVSKVNTKEQVADCSSMLGPSFPRRPSAHHGPRLRLWLLATDGAIFCHDYPARWGATVCAPPMSARGLRRPVARYSLAPRRKLVDREPATNTSTGPKPLFPAGGGFRMWKSPSKLLSSLACREGVGRPESLLRRCERYDHENRAHRSGDPPRSYQDGPGHS